MFKKYISIIVIVLNFNWVYADDVSVYYMQYSQEHKANTSLLYDFAEIQLKKNLEDKNITAFIEQKNDYQNLPEAIILDIDETILDNSAYFAYLIKNNSQYTEETWNEYTNKANARLVMGADIFIKNAIKNNIVVFLVSNRDMTEKESTLKNLKNLGIEIDSKNVLLKNEKVNWTTNKFERYREIAKKYRILMIVGDDFNDFLPVKNLTYKEKDKLFNKYKNYFGGMWIVLPNPIYGSFSETYKVDGLKTFK